MKVAVGGGMEYGVLRAAGGECRSDESEREIPNWTACRLRDCVSDISLPPDEPGFGGQPYDSVRAAIATKAITAHDDLAERKRLLFRSGFRNRRIGRGTRLRLLGISPRQELWQDGLKSSHD